MLLEIDKVCKSFGGLQAVFEVSLAVDEGEIVGLIGPNGSGKTTLFNVISGFLKPEIGAIRLMGEDITGLPAHQVCRKGICRTFQIPKPFENLTVHKAVTMGALLHSSSVREAEEEAERILVELRLEKAKYKMGRELTVMELKRLELGRALAGRPKILLIDEVIAGLNPAEVDEMIQVVRDLQNSGMTVFMIEHVMKAIVAVTDRVFVLDAGRKIGEGKPHLLLNDPVVIEAYIGKEDEDV
jgi:branched-chain amino acid transport system ATP-binding protein